MITCLDNIIGLAGANSDCLESSKPGDFATKNASETGWYITDEDFGAPLLDAVLASNDKQDGSNVWDTLEKVRTTAIKRLEPDLVAALKNIYTTRDKYIDEIGERGATDLANASHSFVGLQIVPNRLKDYKLIIDKIWLGLNESGSFDLEVSSTNPDFTTQNISLTATANTWHENELGTPLELPFYSKAWLNDSYTGKRFRYNMSYPLGTAKPFKNELHCGCSGAKPRWIKFLEIAGIFTNDQSTIGYSKSLKANGLVLDAHIVCDSLAWICELQSIGDFDSRQTIAETLLWSCVELLANHVLRSSETNFWTTLRREAIYGQRNHARKQYHTRLAWIAEHLPKGATNCYECKPFTEIGTL